MRLLYNKTRLPVKVGDLVELDDMVVKIRYFREPHKPSSSGKVSVDIVNTDGEREFYVGVIGAEWIDREDRV